MNESKTRVQDKCVDPDSPTFPPNPQQIKKLQIASKLIYTFSKKKK